jgi:hypothetical protein
MTVPYTFLDDQGLPGLSGLSPTLPAGAVLLPDESSINELDTLIMREGSWTKRRVLPSAELTRTGYRVSGLPDSAMVTVTDLGTGERWEATAADLPEDGYYQIDVTSTDPFWRRTSMQFLRGKGSAEISARQLNSARADAADGINAAVGTLRRRFVTDIPGQEAIYLEKRAEARAYVAQATQAGAPSDLAEYPLLAGEIGVTAPDAWQLAQVWLNRAELFRRVGAATETHRLRALAALATAPDRKTIETIQTTFTEALSRLSL